MGQNVFLVAYVAGAAAVALWVVARFAALAPQTLSRATLHAAAALFGINAFVPVVLHVFSLGGSTASMFVGLFAVIFPALVYVLVAAAWSLKLCQSALTGRLP